MMHQTNKAFKKEKIKLFKSGWPRVDTWLPIFENFYKKEVKLIKISIKILYYLVQILVLPQKKILRKSLKEFLGNKKDIQKIKKIYYMLKNNISSIKSLYYF